MATSAVLLNLFGAQCKAGPNEFAPRRDGFICDWLLLAPIQLPSTSDGAEAINKEQLPKEGLLKPMAGDKVTVGGKELTWKPIQAKDYFFDLNVILNQDTEKTVGYAVTYVRTEAERSNLMLKMGSNDQGKVYLNGKLLLTATEPRSLDQDTDLARNVTLNPGVNVVVFKICNEGNDWQGCLRFTDAGGKAVTNLVIQLMP